MASLYVVGTPIGNLGDITFRAVETLKAVDFIACEDTRHSLRLLNYLGIRKPLLSVRARNEDSATGGVLDRMEVGEDGAYITDAGTPGVSDPGGILVAAVRDAGHEVVPIPGPSALATLISIAGFPGKTYVFEGFLSPKPGKRRKRVKELLDRGELVVFYESPFRIIKLMEDIADCSPGRRVVIGREMTKAYEEFLTGTVEDILEDLKGRSSIKGEFSVLVSAGKNA